MKTFRYALIVMAGILTGTMCFAQTTQTAEVANIKVQVQLDQPGRQIPPSFLGLSVEYSQIQDLTSPGYGHQAALINLVNNIQQFNGPFVFRIGGNSTDRTFWEGLPDTTPHFNNTPINTKNAANKNATTQTANANADQAGQGANRRKTAIVLTPVLIHNLQGLAAGTNCKFILGLNMACDNPNVPLVWAKEAIAGLGRSIMAFEIGNEPSLYAKNGYRHKGYSLADYFKDYQNYVNAIRPVLPDGIQIAGGAYCCGWLESTDKFIDNEHQNVNIVTVHLYPLSGISPRPRPNPDEGENPADNPNLPSRKPTIPNLLKNTSSTMYVTRGAAFLTAAAKFNLPVRWAEMNSANGGGNAATSGSFAAALWAVDTLFEIYHSGAVGVNFHMGANYPTFDWVDENKLDVCPLYYGQLFFAQAVQNHARLIPVSFQTSANVKIWATLDANHVLRVVVINKDLKQDAQITLHLPTNRQAELETLFAPDMTARTGLVIYGGGKIINYDHTINGNPGPVDMDQPYPLNQYVIPQDGVFSFSAPHIQAKMLIVQLPE